MNKRKTESLRRNFIRRNIELCRIVFTSSTGASRKLMIDTARKEIGYSPRTSDSDIYSSLCRMYNRMEIPIEKLDEERQELLDILEQFYLDPDNKKWINSNKLRRALKDEDVKRLARLRYSPETCREYLKDCSHLRPMPKEWFKDDPYQPEPFYTVGDCKKLDQPRVEQICRYL